MIVYFHRHPITNDVFYVGIGVKKERAYRFSGKSRNQYWRNYVKKHGFPVVEIVHEIDTRKEAVELELKYIAQFGRKCDGSGRLVNITIGGDGGSLGMKQSEEHKSKISKALIGKVRTREMRQKYRETQARPEVAAIHNAYKKIPEYKEKQRVAKIGKKQTPEAVASRSKSLMGHKVSEETKRKISLKNTGKVRSAETRKMLGDIQRGRKQTPEAIANKVAASKKLVLNTLTGIYYHGLQEAADSLPMKLTTLRCKMSGHSKNNTPFVYA